VGFRIYVAIPNAARGDPEICGLVIHADGDPHDHGVASITQKRQKKRDGHPARGKDGRPASPPRAN